MQPFLHLHTVYPDFDCGRPNALSAEMYLYTDCKNEVSEPHDGRNACLASKNPYALKVPTFCPPFL